MTPLLSLYSRAFAGLSREAWLLAVVIFINRSGAFVVPFLSVYLTEGLGFKLTEVGFLLSIFGVGAMVGNLLGGWLTDRISSYFVQMISFVVGGAWFVAVFLVQRIELVAAGLFILSVLTESLPPATNAAVSSYSTPETKTRAFSLNRLAMNLGFSIAPLLGGALAMVSYQVLFLADGLSCITAGAVLYFFFRHRQKTKPPTAPLPQVPRSGYGTVAVRSPYKDGLFVVFAILCCGYLVAFSQFFTTMPLYWHQVYSLSKLEIGLLLACNGLLSFLLEMLLIYRLRKVKAFWKMIVTGLSLLALSFLLLTVAQGMAVLVLSVMLLSFSEMLALPFLSTLTAQRSGTSNLGSYMGLYTLTYSAAYIIGPLAGTNTIDQFGFDTLWWGCSLLCLLAAGGFFLVLRRLQPS